MDKLAGLVKVAIMVGVAGVVVFTGLRFAFMDVVVVPHNGMAPTLTAGDEVLVWRGAGIDMADVVWCEHPYRDGQYILSRAIAFPGATLHTDHNGVLYIGGDRTNQHTVGDIMFHDVVRRKKEPMLVGEIQYGMQHTHLFMQVRGRTKLILRDTRVQKGIYVLGDNRSEPSTDSRKHGEIDPDRCIGQVFMRLKPAPDRNDDIDHFYLDWIE